MFKIVKELGPPTWLKPAPVYPSEVLEAMDYLWKYEKGICKHMDTPQLLDVIVKLSECGLRLFEEKDAFLAKACFNGAVAISRLLPDYPDHFACLLHNNVATASFFLESPYETVAALSHHDVTQGKYSAEMNNYILQSMYMTYQFDLAMSHVATVEANFPVSYNKEFQEIKEKLMTNELSQDFPRHLIEQRVSIYRQISPPTSDPRLHTIDIIGIDQLAEEARRIVEDMLIKLEKEIRFKNYRNADRLLVDLNYLVIELQEGLQAKVEDEKLFWMFSKRACCLYHLERYDEALKYCKKANRIRADTAEVLQLEAKTLMKLKKYGEAVAKIYECVGVVDACTVEALICEEILFEATYQMNKVERKAERGGATLESDLLTGQNERSEERTEKEEKKKVEATGGTLFISD